MLSLEPSLAAQFELQQHLKAADKLKLEDAIELLKAVMIQNETYRAVIIGLMKNES
jgi:hypothetical protein